MKYLIIIGMILISITGKTQDYWNAVGVRGGISSGITYKKFMDEENAFEGILSLKRGIKATLLKEIHLPRYSQYSENLYVFHGFGGHFGFLNKDYNSERIEIFSNDIRKGPAFPVIGLDAMLGIEYRFESVPMVFGIEYKPYFDLFAESLFDLHMGDFAFALRYTY